MSIGAALNKSISGLQATQAGLSVISTNIASANTAGYVKRELQITDGSGSGAASPGVQGTEIVRALDLAAQKLLRASTTENADAQTLDDALQQLDALMGGPGSESGIDAAYREFSAALVSASNDRGSDGAAFALTAAAQKLASALKSFSSAIQSLRTNAEAEIGATVRDINTLARSLADVNGQLGTSPDQNDLLDRRDRIVNRLAELGDFNFTEGDNGRMTVTTRGGIALVGIGGAATLDFDGRGTLSAQDSYSTDPALRGVGTITVNGLDLLAGNHFTSGKLGALLSLRDNYLAGSQRMADDLAAGLAIAGSDPAAATGKGMFLDGSVAFTAASRDDPQRVGLAQRLSLNPAYAASPQRIEEMAGAGTTDVFALISSRLATLPVETRAGVSGGAAGSASVQTLASRLVTDHATLVAATADKADAAQAAKNSADKIFSDRNGVDVNAQLADMIGLQNAYAANANVIKTIKTMLDILNNI